MATHLKKVSKNLRGKYQVFSNHTGVTGSVTFANEDLIDVHGSLGSPARLTKILLVGTVEIQILFNVPIKTTKAEVSQVDTTIVYDADMAGFSNLNAIVLKNTTGFLEYEFDFSVSSVWIEEITGTIDADNYVQFMFMT